MKKRLLLFLSMILISQILLMGCSNASQGKSADGGVIPLYTPGVGGINYIISAGVTNLVNSTGAIPNSQMVAETTKGSVEMIASVIDQYGLGRPAIGAPDTRTLQKVYKGELEQIQGEHPELRAISYLSYTALHVVTQKNSGIQSFGDLKGKKVGTFVPGEAVFHFVEGILGEYGITSADYKPIPLTMSEIQDGIRNGSIDAGVITGAIPSPLIRELAQSTDIRLLSIEPEKLKAFLEKDPAFSSIEVKAGTYPGQDTDVIIGTMFCTYITHEKTSDEIVYNFLKTILDHSDQVKTFHPTANITRETVADAINIPLHPGAKKYFDEHGIKY